MMMMMMMVLVTMMVVLFRLSIVFNMVLKLTSIRLYQGLFEILYLVLATSAKTTTARTVMIMMIMMMVMILQRNIIGFIPSGFKIDAFAIM